ncbi:MAG: hypothetical protein J7497_12455, partial [Chitinophagaceae bacterium]|nr:hypothetical protein [Chitinophagaceae bacterium]
MMKNTWLMVLAVVFGTVVFYACSKKSGNDNNNGTSNDEFKSGMLINYADNLIIPAYTDFQSKVNTLETTVNIFLNAPSST